VQYSENQAGKHATGAIEQLLGFPRIGDMWHAAGDRPMRDDLGAVEELIPPHVVTVFVGINHAARHAGPHLAEQLDHLARVRQVRLSVDHHAAPRLMRPELASHIRFFWFSTAKQLLLTCSIFMKSLSQPCSRYG